MGLLAVVMAAEGSSSSQAGKKAEIDLEEMLQKMDLMDEELDEVVIGKIPSGGQVDGDCAGQYRQVLQLNCVF